MVAVDFNDPREAVAKYVTGGGFSFPVALGGKPSDPGHAIFDRYSVDTFPANYLIDAGGKVVWRQIGFEEQTLAELRAALGRLGLK